MPTPSAPGAGRSGAVQSSGRSSGLRGATNPRLATADLP